MYIQYIKIHNNMCICLQKVVITSKLLLRDKMRKQLTVVNIPIRKILLN